MKSIYLMCMRWNWQLCSCPQWGYPIGGPASNLILLTHEILKMRSALNAAVGTLEPTAMSLKGAAVEAKTSASPSAPHVSSSWCQRNSNRSCPSHHPLLRSHDIE